MNGPRFIAASGRRPLAAVLALGLLLTGAEAARAEWSDVERLLNGSQPLSFGLDSSRYRVSTLGAKPGIATEEVSPGNVPYRLIDPELHGTAISFDLKLRWPSSSGAGTVGVVQPYLSFGPTLFVAGVDNVAQLGPGPRLDTAMSLGLSWGAGLSWRFSRNAELFGGYRFLQYGRDSVLSHGERSSEADLSGHDVLYGLSVRF